jgi:oligosaccharide repeat unit polymerase
MKIRKESIQELVLLVLFKALLEVAYVLFVNAEYAYSGFILDPNGIKFLESYIFLIFLYFFLPHGMQRISSIGTKLLLVLMVIPTLSLYALKNGSREYCYLFVGGFLLTLVTIQLLPSIRIPRNKRSTTLLFLALGGISVLVYGMLLKVNGLPSFKALTLGSAVYEIRRVSNWGPKIMGYLVSWQANVINCFLIGLAWYKRRHLTVLAVLSLQLLLFLITAHKSFLLAPFFIIALVYIIQKKRPFRLILWGAIAGVILSFALYSFGVSNMPASLFIRRTLFVPARISFQYYDFFSKNELTYLSQSHLGIFLPTNNPYKDHSNLAKMMGGIYTGNPECNMNTGYMGDAYMNFGPLGVFIFSVMLGVFFLIADSVARNTDKSLAVAALAMPIIGLVNGALFTNFLTGGFLIGLLVLYLYTKHEAKRTVIPGDES